MQTSTIVDKKETSVLMDFQDRDPDFYLDIVKEVKKIGQTNIKLQDLGSQKLSLECLREMGRADVTSLEMSALIHFAKVQNESGVCYTNYHMFTEELGCSQASFMNVLHGLENKGLITFWRSSDYRKSKIGIYKIMLRYNNFVGKNLKEYHYVRLNHRLFREKRFRDLTPTAKYILLYLVYEMRLDTYQDFKNNRHFPICPYLACKKDTIKWGCISERTFQNALYSIKKVYGCEIRKIKQPRGARPISKYKNIDNRFLYVNLDGSLMQKDCSDGYSRICNLLYASFEEQGIHIADKIDPHTLASFIICYEKKAKIDIKEANMKYDHAKRLPDLKKKDVKQKRRSLKSKCFQIARDTMYYHTCYGLSQDDGSFCKWGSKKIQGKVIQMEKLPNWLTYLMSNAISAYHCVRTLSKILQINLETVDFSECMNTAMGYLLRNKKVKYKQVVKKIFQTPKALAESAVI